MKEALLRSYFVVLVIAVGTAVPALAKSPKEASLVTTTKVISKPLQQVVPLSGTTEALRSSGLSPRIEGLVADLYVKEGDWVEAGQTLLQLDNTLAKTQVASERARLTEAKVRYDDAKRQRSELASLRDKQHIAVNTLESAMADENAAKANVAAQRADLQRSQELLARHTLKAPFNGIIAEKLAEIGEWVQEDAAVVRLVDLDTLQVRAPLPQRYFQTLARESDARIVFDALPGESFPGKLTSIVSVGNQRTRSFPLYIDIDNQQHHIAPGMSAQVFVELQTSDLDALMVPRDAVILRADGSRLVWRVKKGDDSALKVESVKVLIGRAQGKFVEVLDSTLKVGDRIVMLGNENLRPGQAIRISNTDPEQ